MGSINQPIEDPLYTLEYIEDPLYIYIHIIICIVMFFEEFLCGKACRVPHCFYVRHQWTILLW